MFVMFVLNMCVKVGGRTRLVFASGTYEFFAALGGTSFEQRLGLATERCRDGHTPE